MHFRWQLADCPQSAQVLPARKKTRDDNSKERGSATTALSFWHNSYVASRESAGKFVPRRMTTNRKRRSMFPQRLIPVSLASLTVFAALFAVSAAVSASAADPASITFSLDFPNSSPEHYSIAVDSDGRAHYESSGKIVPDSDDRDTYQTDFTFSAATRARIFDLATQAHYFAGKVDSGNKKLAFTGAKKLVYKDGQRDTSASYNYSSQPAVQQLTMLFQSVGATLEFSRRLAYFHRYQKLALDDELKRMEDQARRGDLAEIQAVKPVLQEIYDDSSVINVVRARARRIMDLPPGTSSTR